MEKKYCYNYKQIFDEPFKMYSLGRLKIPFIRSITIGSFLMYIFFGFILWAFFRNVIASIGHILSGSQWVIYFGLPYVLTRQINKLHPDGKKLHIYLIELGLYLWQIQFLKKKFCADEVVSDVGEKQCFERKIIILEGEE